MARRKIAGAEKKKGIPLSEMPVVTSKDIGTTMKPFQLLIERLSRKPKPIVKVEKGTIARTL
jgi:hypothetical protein